MGIDFVFLPHVAPLALCYVEHNPPVDVSSIVLTRKQWHVSSQLFPLCRLSCAMWVHFHNETKIREYTTSDWDEFITVIENDIGTDRGIEKLTYKPSKLGDEYEVNPDSFDEIIGNPGSHGVFNVYFAVRRMARFPSEREPHEIFAIDFEHFVQQVESISGSTVCFIVLVTILC